MAQIAFNIYGALNVLTDCGLDNDDAIKVLQSLTPDTIQSGTRMWTLRTLNKAANRFFKESKPCLTH